MVAHDYQEPDFEQPAPYQVQLDGGKLIYAPEDTDECPAAECRGLLREMDTTGRTQFSHPCRRATAHRT